MSASLPPFRLVLVHGLCDWHAPERTFGGLAEDWSQLGWPVCRPLLRGAPPLDERARRMWAQVPDDDVPLLVLGHSLGGLVARHWLRDDRIVRRIRGVATVATPHGGVPGAAMLRLLGASYRDISPAARSGDDVRHRAREEDVLRRYGIGRVSVRTGVDRPSHRRLWLSHRVVRSLAGHNDGLVPVSSQTWGETVIDATLDHVTSALIHPRCPRRPEAVALWTTLVHTLLPSLPPPRILS